MGTANKAICCAVLINVGDYTASDRLHG
uniref:Uncharacterized protein n=1 Tax=Arundo donax TaxID=35708 RepID=A0A0A9C1D1_ARUDO